MHAAHEIFENGLAVGATNVTATLQARHPKVTGITYVPYYLLFDEHGELVYHHQGGPYHGGDRTAVLDRVRDRVAELPRIYVGKTPYPKHTKLAAQVAEGKRLGSTLARLARALEAAPKDTELARLVKAVERYATRETAVWVSQLAISPKKAHKRLQTLASAYRDTPWGEKLKAAAARHNETAARSQHKQAAEKLRVIRSAWTKLTPSKGNGGRVRNPIDPTFRKRHRAALDLLLGQIDELTATFPETPAAAWAQGLGQLLKR